MKHRNNKSFFYKVKNEVCFSYNGRDPLQFTKFPDSALDDTKVKFISGLNHFLSYVYDHRDEDDIEYVVNYIIREYYRCVSYYKWAVKQDDFEKALHDSIIEICCVGDHRLLSICYDYIDHYTDEDIDESAATVDMTLTNKQVKILIFISLLAKFSYLFSFMIRSSILYNNLLDLFVEKLTANAIEIYVEKNENITVDDKESMAMTVDEIHTGIDEYIVKLVSYQWDLKAKTNAYKDKFNRIGLDPLLSAKRNKVEIYSAFKKFTLRVVDLETANKYSTSANAMDTLYWTQDKDPEDFRYKNKALTGYLQTTLRNIISKQVLSKPFAQDINVTSILMNVNEETSLRRENSLYEDKEGHLLELRQNSAKNLFKMTLDEIQQYDYELRVELPKFNVNNNHHFNQFILSKIFLSLTGEHIVYKEFYGPFSKVILALFYIRILECHELAFMADVIDLMKSEGRPNSELYKLATVEQALLDNDIDVDPNVFKSIIGVYRDGLSDESYVLKLDMFIELFKFLDSPYRVRNLLFPNVYESKDMSASSIRKYSSRKEFDTANKLKDMVLGGVRGGER